MSENEFFYQDWDFWKISLDIETGIETFRIAVLISRLVLRLSGLQSWYQDWYWDFQDCSPEIETGIKTFQNVSYKLPVLISRVVLRLKDSQSWYQDWYWDFKNLSLDIKTGIKTFRIRVLILILVSRLSEQSCRWGTISRKTNVMVETHPEGRDGASSYKI